MAYVHVAHDVRIGSQTVLANSVTFGGHVVVDDWAVIEAFSGVHQFCRVGRHAIRRRLQRDHAGCAAVFDDRESARVATCSARTKSGLERRGVSKEDIESLHKAFRLLTKSGLNTTQAVERISAEVEIGPEIEELLAFIASSERGFVK